jgi:hypothetical protein
VAGGSIRRDEASDSIRPGGEQGVEVDMCVCVCE